ncbi:MAG: VWA domain-containing protein, partial [Planctomycetota bacterium]
ASARAGAKMLALGKTAAQTRAAIQQVAAGNTVGGKPLTLADSDIEFGIADVPETGGRRKFSANVTGRPNAVRINAGRTSGSADGPVPLIFANVLGVSSFEPVQVATAKQISRDICLVIDRSGSMRRVESGGKSTQTSMCDELSPDSRFASLARAIQVFLDELGNTPLTEKVALATYSGPWKYDCDLDKPGFEVDNSEADIRVRATGNYTKITDALAAMNRYEVAGDTAIGVGLRKGMAAVTGSGTKADNAKTIVLMTDGIHNRGVDPVKVAKDAAAEGINVYTITFSVEADKTLMKKVAEETGGVHIHADDSAQLIAAYRQIARLLPIVLTE